MNRRSPWEETSLAGVLVGRPRAFPDERGQFMEIFRASHESVLGLSGPFVQDNFSRSRRGVIRGMHYQRRSPQGKLITVLRGRIWDVVADIRNGSPTFGRWFGVELSEEGRRQLFVPAGYAHGFCALSEEADLMYKATAYYDPSDERGFRWNDPHVTIAWPVTHPIVSPKDAALPFLAEIPAEERPEFSVGS
jgi:dTDP-4-dehydrorhamnose 3,5-epimerase